MSDTITRILTDLPNRIYHADPATASTTLKTYRKSPTPAHAKHALQNPKGDRKALDMGQCLHTLTLEEHRLDLDFVIEKEKLPNKSTIKGGKETWDAMKAEAIEREVPLIPFDMYQQCLGMQRSIVNHEYWQRVRRDGQKEISIFSQIKGHPVKARPDALYDSLILDIKTTRHQLTDGKIASIIASEGYHLSAAMYLEVARAAGLDVKGFVWVFVESNAPYLCRFVQAMPNMLETGRQEFYSALDMHIECSKAKSWPGYSPDILPLELPVWYSSNLPVEELVYESDHSDGDDDGY